MAVHPRVLLIGPGRMGEGVGRILAARGIEVTLVGRGPRTLAVPLRYEVGIRAELVAASDWILIATPDSAIAGVAERLRLPGMVESRHVVLHMSAVLDVHALSSLRPTGAALGSFHPLQSVADPNDAAWRLAGAFAGLEGDERALVAGRELANHLLMEPIRLPAGAKVGYHAAATLVVHIAAVVAVAERIGRQAGIPAEAAARMYLPLLAGTVKNIEAAGAAAALTGAVRRGDAATVARHLAALDGSDRTLYLALAREALEIAREAGLSADAAAALARILVER